MNHEWIQIDTIEYVRGHSNYLWECSRCGLLGESPHIRKTGIGRDIYTKDSKYIEIRNAPQNWNVTPEEFSYLSHNCLTEDDRAIRDIIK